MIMKRLSALYSRLPTRLILLLVMSIEEDYDWASMSDLINNSEGNIKWKDDKNPFEVWPVVKLSHSQ